MVCPADPLMEYARGDTFADAKERNGCPMREADFCEVEKGVARDFQYVSTAPPISSVTPRNGVIIVTSNETLSNEINLIHFAQSWGGG